MLCASPAYLAEYGVPGSPAELAVHKCIFFRFPATGLIQALGTVRYAADGRFRAAAVVTVNNIEAAIRLSAAGMGIAYVPILSCARPWMRDNCRRCCPAVASRMGISGPGGPPAATCHREYAVYLFYGCGQRYLCHQHRRPLPSEKPCAGYPAARPAKAGGRCASSIIRSGTTRRITRYFCASKR